MNPRLRLTLVGLAVASPVYLAWWLSTGHGVHFDDPLAYIHAAQRLLSTGSPYAPWELTDQLTARTRDAYLYPPPLAQILVPLTLLPESWAVGLWAIFDAVCLFLAVWLVSRSRFLTLTLPLAFGPALLAMSDANAEGPLALALALALTTRGARAPLTAGLATLVKLVPATWLVPIAVSTPRAALRAVVPIGVILSLSVILSPTAWIQYPTMFGFLLRGSTDLGGNLEPTGTLRWGALLLAAGLLTYALFLGCAGRRTQGLLAATLAGFLLPATFWFYYLALLLPFLALALPILAGRRLGLAVLGLVLFSTPIAFPIVTFAPIVLWIGIVATCIACWPIWRTSIPGSQMTRGQGPLADMRNAGG